jgi:hypothetical protein
VLAKLLACSYVHAGTSLIHLKTLLRKVHIVALCYLLLQCLEIKLTDYHFYKKKILIGLFLFDEEKEIDTIGMFEKCFLW